tara:strand:+ start:177 stop:440 length:264 start_codon:yes stop_codon:yes gene_type:complete
MGRLAATAHHQPQVRQARILAAVTFGADLRDIFGLEAILQHRVEVAVLILAGQTTVTVVIVILTLTIFIELAPHPQTQLAVLAAALA